MAMRKRRVAFRQFLEAENDGVRRRVEDVQLLDVPLPLPRRLPGVRLALGWDIVNETKERADLDAAVGRVLLPPPKLRVPRTGVGVRRDAWRVARGERPCRAARVLDLWGPRSHSGGVGTRQKLQPVREGPRGCSEALVAGGRPGRCPH